jgi:hypothetical protein
MESIKKRPLKNENTSSCIYGNRKWHTLNMAT